MRRFIATILYIALAASAIYFARYMISGPFQDNTRKHIESTAKPVAKDKTVDISKTNQQIEVERKALEEAWEKYYKAPEGCDSYDLDAHMVECINHRMRARKEFENDYPNIEFLSSSGD